MDMTWRDVAMLLIGVTICFIVILTLGAALGIN